MKVDMDKVRSFDVAVSILGSLIGACSHERRQEKAKVHPDLTIMSELDTKHSLLWKERQDLRLEDEAAILRVLNEYGPIVKAEKNTGIGC